MKARMEITQLSSPNPNQKVLVSKWDFLISGHRPNLNESQWIRSDNKQIVHKHIKLLGDTTNILVFSLFDSNLGKEFTREEIRIAIESHKTYLEKSMSQQEIARIQSGKAAVNYWIDRLVKGKIIEKRNSNPVVFWKSVSNSNEDRNSNPVHKTYNVVGTYSDNSRRE